MNTTPEYPLKFLKKARLLATLSACFFFLAAFSVADTLQEMIRHDFNHIDIIPGEEILITGLFPAGAALPSDITSTITDNGLSFTVLEAYKGFWMGGQMWRARLTASANASSTNATLTVTDILPERAEAAADRTKPTPVNPVETPGLQNPALVHSITIWPSEEERLKAQNSWIRRNLHLPPLGAGGLALAGALLTGLGHFFLFRKAQELFAQQKIFFIHGVKSVPGGVNAIFSMGSQHDLITGAAMNLWTPNWQRVDEGTLIEQTKGSGHALFTGTPPRYGWLLEYLG